MKIIFYTHSLMSDWNHGNAHFLRGVMRELARLGHEVLALEPADGWSRANLLADQGPAALARFSADFPGLASQTYGTDFDHAAATADADLVIVHEWTAPALVALLGRLRRQGGGFTLLFHDTHHRAVSALPEIAGLNLGDYDGVLAFGEALRQRYLSAGWGRRVFTWHEAADTALFRPWPDLDKQGDLVWIGNWGDDERSAEIDQYLVEPVRRLGLAACVHGVRYPADALTRLAGAGIRYRGWIANADVPHAFARHRVTVHIPRRPYVESLPGIPTIRMFEALACGIPLVSAPWQDVEGLFRPGRDFLFARNGWEMQRHLSALLADRAMAAELAASGLATIQAAHTCRHRAAELLGIVAQVRGGPLVAPLALEGVA
ncbi:MULTISPECIES: glycosyltransferase [unclassified Azospirillum]|uniref:CgeB family protein n=1 Tax=unclassified Azospirillum TaxID=2630922 RepID=UPI000B766EB3|nr:MULTISPECIES: glycosyltransferase [unclassified Azospirillum]SNS10935.1 Spore maturation protein CgeB [Azospirillum sp. RU38E]SNS27626.1 Spore maturation protein CgeB [Azospirillum sp. RU37A]